NVRIQTSRPVGGEPSGRPNLREAPIQERGNIPMNERRQIDPRNENLLLARWLQQVMAADSTSTGTGASPGENNEYHPYFYQQLQDFVMAFFEEKPQANFPFPPLFFNLLG